MGGVASRDGRSGREPGRAGARPRAPERWRNGRPWAARTIGAAAPGRQADPAAGPGGQRLLTACRWKLRARAPARIAPMADGRDAQGGARGRPRGRAQRAAAAARVRARHRGGGRGRRRGLRRGRGGAPRAGRARARPAHARRAEPAGDPAPGRAEPADARGGAHRPARPELRRRGDAPRHRGLRAQGGGRASSSCGRSASPPRAAPTSSRGSARAWPPTPPRLAAPRPS